jgi:hypothetical protein
VPELIATSSNHVSDLKIHGANIYALYTDGVQLKLAQRPLSGGSWTIETVATQDSTTHRSSLFFANDNTPYVAFMKGIVTNITLKVYKKTAGVWSEVFSKSDLQFHSEHWYHGQSPTMMQKNSNIYVVYADNYKVYLTNLNAQSITQQYVSLTGFDTNDGLTTISAKRTITSALASVMEGGNINVMAGTYNETVNVTKNITLGTSGVVSIQNLTMNGVGKTLVLSSPLRVSQVVALQAGTIASSGNLILNSDVAGTALVDDFTSGYTGNITGNVQVKRYVANGNAGYRYFGSPVTGATASQFGATTFAYNESILLRDMNAGWQVMAGSATITPFSAYNVWQNTPNNQTYTLTGAINTGSYNMAITRQTPIINTTTGAVTNNSAGFNAIGNPYPSPISWTGLLSLNSGVTTGTAWLFKTTELYKGQWASLNSSGIGTNGATNMIASMQGFLVRKATAGSGNFTINNSIRSNVFANNGNYLRAVEKPLVRLQITNGEVADETVMYVEQGATDKFDVNFDTEKLVGEADKPYIAFTTANQDVSILAMERLPRNVGTPLIIRGNGIFDLKITEKLSIDEKVFLYDRKTNELHDLEAKYTFQITGTENNRFVLYIGKPTQEQLAEGGENIRIWTNEKTLFVRFATLDLAKESQADILTIQGQPIITNLSFSEADTQKILSLPIGVYIIRVKNQQGITSKKMLVR